MLKSMIIKEIKQIFRDRKAMTMMTIFPVLLIMILGAAFSNAFSGDNDTVKIEAAVLYSISEDSDGAIFEEFKVEAGKMGVKFDESTEEKAAIDKVKDSKYSCYLQIKAGEIIIYKNDRLNLEANFVEALLKGFVDKYNLIYEVMKYNPEAATFVMSSDQINMIEKTTLDKKKAPRAIDYYAVTMVSLFVMYSAMTGIYTILNERTRKTGNRILLSAISKNKLLTGKLVGSLIATVFQITAVVIASKYILKANWGEDMLTIALILITEAILFISLGIGIAFLVKSESAATGLMNTIIPVVAFLGGAYVNLEQFGGDLLIKATTISPLRWVNKSIMNIVYNNDYSTVLNTILINVIAAIVIIIMASALYRKEEH